jgi:hypothetical protein
MKNLQDGRYIEAETLVSACIMIRETGMLKVIFQPLEKTSVKCVLFKGGLKKVEDTGNLRHKNAVGK